MFNEARALELLRAGTSNNHATFRPGQLEAIRNVVVRPQRQLVVQRTGWGKSAVYFIASKMLSEQGRGITVLISPLLALMRNQIAAAERMGVRALTINSTNVDNWSQVERQVVGGRCDVLMISPERLNSERFRDEVWNHIVGNVAMLVVDEAHCISDWGHDFRPHYRLIERILRNLPSNVRVLATTATANNRVIDDLTEVFGAGLQISRGPLEREGLSLQTVRLADAAERLVWLDQALNTIEGSGIIYVLTLRDAHRVTDYLKTQGHRVKAYTSKSEDRPALEEELVHNDVRALVATVALGMGFDKPDLAFVFHYQMPGSVVAYYQQVGRAGRGIAQSRGVLLSGREDDEIIEYFIESAFPTQREVESVIDQLEESEEGCSVAELEKGLNLRRGAISKVLLMLSIEDPAPIAKEGTKWFPTIHEVSVDFWRRAERLTALRRTELDQMKAYTRLADGEHMAFLLNALDGPPPVKPGFLPPLELRLNPSAVAAAQKFLRRAYMTFEPRKMWPTGLDMPHLGVRGRISPDRQAMTGQILSLYNDAGWGTEVKQGKYERGRFSDDLVQALVDMVYTMRRSQQPRWVACIPSHRHPELVPDLARRFAQRLGLPFHPVLQIAEKRPAQKTMENSAHQCANLDRAFRIVGSVPSGPVFLIDDLVDSKWTFTVAAYLLLEHGAGSVYPIALASTAKGE